MNINQQVEATVIISKIKSEPWFNLNVVSLQFSKINLEASEDL